jgi:L-lactate dehydrogenase complex protein LldG
VYVSARQTASLVPGAGRSTVDVQAMDDPHHVVDVEFALLPGEFAVAENAAVWITDATVRHRVLYFACQHLGLVVPAGQIVHNLAEAYQRISLTGPQFGAFLAGPSKTADIEQSLVIGAHGPKSLTVFLLGSPDQ